MHPFHKPTCFNKHLGLSLRGLNLPMQPHLPLQERGLRKGQLHPRRLHHGPDPERPILRARLLQQHRQPVLCLRCHRLFHRCGSWGSRWKGRHHHRQLPFLRPSMPVAVSGPVRVWESSQPGVCVSASHQ